MIALSTLRVALGRPAMQMTTAVALALSESSVRLFTSVAWNSFGTSSVSR